MLFTKQVLKEHVYGVPEAVSEPRKLATFKLYATTAIQETMDFVSASEENIRVLKDLVVLQGAEIDERISFKEDTKNAEGAGIFSVGDVKRGDTLINIPFNLCISVEKILESKLKIIFDENPGLLQYPDEVIALGLMHGLGDKDCDWHQHILTMPSTFNTPLYWSDEEVDMLKGSVIFHLTGMMKRRLAADFEALHEPLIQEYPELLHSANLQKYIWAMSVIYSRAIGIYRHGDYIRCITPLIDMANHSPAECGPGIETLSYSESGDFLYLVCSKDAPPRTQIYVRYQAYPNSKLLYSYGFVLSDCPDRAIDLWPRVPPTAYRAQDKDVLLKSQPLTAEQTYDFKGTIRDHYVCPALLATCRVIKADEADWANIENAFRGEIISVKNELAAYESLYGLIIARMQTDLAQVCQGVIVFFNLLSCLISLCIVCFIESG